jgi:hypothetical protein
MDDEKRGREAVDSRDEVIGEKAFEARAGLLEGGRERGAAQGADGRVQVIGQDALDAGPTELEGAKLEIFVLGRVGRGSRQGSDDCGETVAEGSELGGGLADGLGHVFDVEKLGGREGGESSVEIPEIAHRVGDPSEDASEVRGDGFHSVASAGDRVRAKGGKIAKEVKMHRN